MSRRMVAPALSRLFSLSQQLSPRSTRPLFHSSAPASTMATSTRIVVDPDNTGPWQVRQTAEAAAKVSELLQEDLEKHNVFFNERNFHNHITHQLLSLYGTGASAACLQAAYDHNKTYQLPARQPHRTQQDGFSAASPAASDWYENTAVKKGLLGQAAYYPDFLGFFQHEIDTAPDGWQGVVARRLLGDSPAAHDLLVRLYAGILHPLIQLMYGLVWQQPAIVAQGLAQAAVHKTNGLEKILQASDDGVVDEPVTDLVSLLSLYEIVAGTPARTRENDKISNKSDSEIESARVPVETVMKIVRVKATPEAVAKRTAEMAETTLYVTASAALHANPRKEPRFDFFLMHHITSIPFFFALNALDDRIAPPRTKARLLSYKIRLGLKQYAGQGYPPLQPLPSQDVYGNADDKAAPAATTTARDISPAAAAAAARLLHVKEDGHAIKLVLATAEIERAVQKDPRYVHAPWRLIPSDATWRTLYRLETDPLQKTDDPWIGTAGNPDSWKDVPDR